MTPAALSFQIRNLEELLAHKLFDRGNRTIALTADGERLFPGVREGFEKLAGAVDQLDQGGDESILDISVGPAFATKWLTPRLIHFLERHPDIDPRISATLKQTDFDREQTDVAIRFGAGPYPGLRMITLLEDSVTPMCSPEMLTGPPAIIRPEDLHHHTLIHDDSLLPFPGAPDWASWFEAVGIEQPDLGRGLHFNHADHALDAAIEGNGVVLGRTVLAERDLRLGRLVAPFDVKLPLTQRFRLVYREGLDDRPKIAAFREWLLAEIGSADTMMTGPSEQ